MKKTLKGIPTELIHANTTFRKRLISAEENKGRIATWNYAWLEKGKELEKHSHPDGEEFYLFLEGKGEMLVGENWFPVEKEDFVTVPIDRNHSVRNTDKQNLIFLTLRTISEK